VATNFHFDLHDFPEEARALRREVRQFLADSLASRGVGERARSWTEFDRDFSRAVGARGWIGMTWPKTFEGRERSALERYVVLEEMLIAGAPVGAHWTADRQSGPLLLRVGTEKQKRDFLPRIIRGELAFCIGLSEPDSGSDLASLRAKATKIAGGWRLNGTKIWTTNAQHSDFMIGLFRTGASNDNERHIGLSQFLIDLRGSGVEIRPIADLTGESHFNEVHFDNVFVPDDLIIGREGDGWTQVNAELAFERSGPDRYLSTYPLIPAAIDFVRQSSASRETARNVGRMVARMSTLRSMSIAVAGMLQAGATPLQEAALIKDLGVDLEQDTTRFVEDIVDLPPAFDHADGLAAAVAYVTQVAPTFSLRGGTREIMRGLTARGLGLR
jgi:alkylation response protein AidB-like acyl-CoA dehydrogenase